VTLADVLWHASDCVFPRLRPLCAQDIQRQKDLAAEQLAYCEQCLKDIPLKDEDAVLARYLADCKGLLDAEDSRREGVEARLTSILGLFTIAGTIVFSGIVAQAVGTVRAPNTFSRWTFALGAFYLALQICCALGAALAGLGRRKYEMVTPPNIFMAAGESPAFHAREQITNCLRILDDHRQQNNDKVSQMAVAHRAMKNFIFALMLFAAIGTVAAIRVKASEDNLIRALRKNHELNEMLRGPQGERGQQGPTGPKGDPGPGRVAPPRSTNK